MGTVGSATAIDEVWATPPRPPGTARLGPEYLPAQRWVTGDELRVRRMMPDQTPVAAYCSTRRVCPDMAWRPAVQEPLVGGVGVFVQRDGSMVELEFGHERSWWPVACIHGAAILPPPGFPYLPKRDECRPPVADDDERIKARRGTFHTLGQARQRSASVATSLRRISQAITFDRERLAGTPPGDGGRRRSRVGAAAHATDRRLTEETSLRRPTDPQVEATTDAAATTAAESRGSHQPAVQVTPPPMPDLGQPRRPSLILKVTVPRRKVSLGDWVEVRDGPPSSAPRIGVVVTDPVQQKWQNRNPPRADDESDIQTEVGTRRHSTATVDTSEGVWVHWCLTDGRTEFVSRISERERVVRASRAAIAKAWWREVFQPWTQEQAPLWAEFEVGTLAGLDPAVLESSAHDDLFRDGPPRRGRGGSVDSAGRFRLSPRGPPPPYGYVQSRQSVCISDAAATPKSKSTPPARVRNGANGRPASPAAADLAGDDAAKPQAADGPFLPPSVREAGSVAQCQRHYDEWYSKAYKRYWQSHLGGYLKAKQDELGITPATPYPGHEQTEPFS